MSQFLSLTELKRQFDSINSWRDHLTKEQLWIIDHATLCICHSQNEPLMKAILEETMSPFVRQIKLKVSDYVTPNTILFLDEMKLDRLDSYWLNNT